MVAALASGYKFPVAIEAIMQLNNTITQLNNTSNNRIKLTRSKKLKSIKVKSA